MDMHEGFRAKHRVGVAASRPDLMLPKTKPAAIGSGKIKCC